MVSLSDSSRLNFDELAKVLYPNQGARSAAERGRSSAASYGYRERSPNQGQLPNRKTRVRDEEHFGKSTLLAQAMEGRQDRRNERLFEQGTLLAQAGPSGQLANPAWLRPQRPETAIPQSEAEWLRFAGQDRDWYAVQSRDEVRRQNEDRSLGTRGARYNNPTNLRTVSGGWDGEYSDLSAEFHAQWGDPEDTPFAVFPDPFMGFRAAAMDMQTKFYRGPWDNQKSAHTIAELAELWAPNSQNDTEKYIRDMVEFTGFSRDEVFDVNDPEVLTTLLEAMSRKEIGKYIYPRELIRAAVDEAQRDWPAQRMQRMVSWRANNKIEPQKNRQWQGLRFSR